LNQTFLINKQRGKKLTNGIDRQRIAQSRAVGDDLFSSNQVHFERAALKSSCRTGETDYSLTNGRRDKFLQADATSVGFLAVESLPEFVDVVDDVGGEFSILGLPVEGESVFRLAVRNLVNAVPLDGGLQQTRTQSLNILNVYK